MLPAAVMCLVLINAQLNGNNYFEKRSYQHFNSSYVNDYIFQHANPLTFKFENVMHGSESLVGKGSGRGRSDRQGTVE